MKKHVVGTHLFVMGFLLMGALAWAAPAAAGGTGVRPSAPGLSFLFDKDAFAIPGLQAEAGTAQSFSKLSLKLYGGYGNIAAGDVNAGSSFYFDLIEFYSAAGEGSVTGGYNPLHGGFNFGADLIYQITPKIGIGLGVGYMRNSADSLATYTQADLSVDITAEPTLEAIPIRLGVFLTFPLNGKLDLTANAGAAYYAGLQFDATQRLDYLGGDWMEQSLSGRQRSGADIGFHGSLGLEYKLSPKMGFFVEAVGRYANLNNFKTVSAITNDSFGGGETIDGVLYLVTDTLDGTEISMFTVETAPPSGGTFREPKFDLSGFSLQAGIHIRF